MARAANQATTTTLEQRLRDATGALHGKQEPSEYQHVVLGLVFLTYISDRVGDRRAHNPGIEMDWIPTPRSEPLPVAQRGHSSRWHYAMGCYRSLILGVSACATRSWLSHEPGYVDIGRDGHHRAGSRHG